MFTLAQGEHSDTDPIGTCQIRQKGIGNCWIPSRRFPIGFYRTSEIMGILWILGESNEFRRPKKSDRIPATRIRRFLTKSHKIQWCFRWEPIRSTSRIVCPGRQSSPNWRRTHQVSCLPWSSISINWSIIDSIRSVMPSPNDMLDAKVILCWFLLLYQSIARGPRQWRHDFI